VLSAGQAAGGDETRGPREAVDRSGKRRIDTDITYRPATKGLREAVMALGD